MAFDDTYRESIQSKHLANVGFTSTAKGITNEGYALKNPHQVLPTQIPAVDIVGVYGPLVASGIAAGLVEQYTVKLTADPTVNNNKAWIAYADDDIEVGHAGAPHIRLDQWMRYAETQYKLRLYQDNGAGTSPNYSAEVLPSETTFNWDYEASAGIVYLDEDPSANGKTLPLWGVFYKYVGETLADKIDTTTSGSGGNFIGLTDTPIAYNSGRVLFESDSAVVDDVDFIYDSATNTLEIINLDMVGDATIGGALTLSSGTSVNEIVTAMGVGSTDDQLPTAKAVYDAIEAKPNDFLGLTDTFMTNFTEGRLFVETPTGIVDFAELTYVSGTETFNAPNAYFTDTLEVDGAVTLNGTLGFDTGVTIDEFVSSLDALSTDSQVPTAASVYDLINTISGSLQGAVIWEVVDTPTQQIRPKIEHQGKAVYSAGNLTIGGDLTVSGTTTTVHSQELTVTDKVITVNAGEVGAGITGDNYAGIEVDRGSETNYMFVFDEIQDNFRVGISGSLQAVATREDVPNDGYVAVWNAAAVRFDTPIAVNDLATDTELTTISGFLQGEIDTLEGEFDSHTHTFLELTDTISSYNTGRILFTTSSGVVDSADFMYDSISGTLTITGDFIGSNMYLGGTEGLTLSSGTSANAIVTDFLNPTDDQIPTALAVKEAIDGVSSSMTEYFLVNAAYDGGIWKYNGGFSSVPSNIQIYYNGVLNKDGDSEYYTINVNAGTLEITFAFTTHPDDWVAVVYGDTAGGAGPRLTSWVTKNAAYTALAGDRIMMDTSAAAFIITLPVTPSTGDEIVFLDAGGNCGTNNVTLGRNGNNIMGLAQDLDIDTNDASFSLVYFNATRGWIIK